MGERSAPVPSRRASSIADGRRVYFDSPWLFRFAGQRTLVEPDELIDVPDEVEDDLAVSFGISGLAAWLALTWRAELREGESVLVSAERRLEEIAEHGDEHRFPDRDVARPATEPRGRPQSAAGRCGRSSRPTR